MSFHPNDVTRRSRATAIILAAAFVLLGSAFYRAQVLQHSDWVVQAEDNRLSEVPLPAARGIIYDRNGKIIAENLPGYTVSILAPSADSLRAALRRLGEIIPYSTDDIETAVKRYNRAPHRPAVILSDANFQEVSVLEEHRTEFPSVIIQSTPKRWYPDSNAVAAFVGYTGEISEGELASPRWEGYTAGMRIGKSGIERQYEGVLRGREGYRFVEVDARGRVVREAGARADQQPETGGILHTNIDLDLQRFVASYFADSVLGSAVALDPKTGGVLALHSGPSFNPNRFTGGIPKSYYDSLNTDPRRPMYNKAVQGRYPPASTFKLATAILGLQEGLVTMQTRQPVPCSGGYQHGNRWWRCWDRRGHGNLTLQQAIEKSCNVYFYQLGLQLKLTGMLAGGVKLGFREASGIDLPSETRPEFPYALEYYQKRYPRGFVQSSASLYLSIGQGENAQTVINMAKFYTALANDGVSSRPSIAKQLPQQDTLFRLTEEQMDGIRSALAGVVSFRGTAGSAALQGVTIAGKTGTAQAPPNPDHAWFVGFAPANDPQIVVAVFLEFGEHGYSAARIASKIIEAYLKKPAQMEPGVAEGQ